MGIGIGYEKLLIDSLKSSHLSESGLKFEDKRVGFSKLFLMAEGYPIRSENFKLGIMANTGIYRLDKQFSQSVITNQFLFSTGIVGEFKFNNRFRWYLNPQYQFKSYDIINSIQNKIGSGQVIVGVRYIVL